MKTLIYYHDADLDGLCSGAILYQYARFKEGVEPSDIELVPSSYGMTIPWDDITGNRVFMADFSFQPWSEMAELYVRAADLTWIDHHKSAIELCEKAGVHIKGIQDTRAAACELAWEFCNPDQYVPKGVRLLSRYDTWDLDEEVLDFQFGMQGRWMEPDHMGWSAFLGQHYAGILEIIKEGQSIRKFVEREYKRTMRARGFETDFKGYRALACNQHAATGSLLFKSHWNPTRHDIMMSFHLRRDGRWSFSIYTEKLDIDCSKIAAQFGGGGHQAAAGFQYDGNLRDIIMY